MTDNFVIPDGIEPIIGWRCWRLRATESGRLCSVVTGSVTWEPYKALEAECRRRTIQPLRWNVYQDHDAPHEPCRCGIYAARRESHMRQIALVNRASVIGKVALWGKVIEGPEGWRAQYAYPIELTLLERGIQWTKAVDLLGLAYGVPVTVEKAT